jgi:2-oxoglutarate ferredoxin oxidoreductase subunit alpha
MKMKLNILIGGKAGQGINKISEIVANVLANLGYFTFNYRDYGSLIRGGHNFNVLSVSDERVGSIESKMDVIVALDENTLKIHNKELKKNSFTIDFKGFEDLGRNLNIALAGALVRILGIDKKELIKELKEELNVKGAKDAAEKGYESEKKRFDLKKLKNKIKIMSGSEAIAQGAVKSDLDLYFAYPMTPATGVLHELGLKQDGKHRVFQAENEIAVINMALGASYAGKKVMVGTSGGGFDLMSEAMSFSGQAEIPLVMYLASRPGPGTGVPTYSSQSDLDVALRAGHGEFPRVVIAPGDPVECVEKINEGFYIAEKFKTLAIILSDKHLAESQFSFPDKENKILRIDINRGLPGQEIVRANGYEHDEQGHTTEKPEIVKIMQGKRVKKYEEIKNFLQKDGAEMIKIYGREESKNLVIGWGSTKTLILDAIKDLNWKFLQVLYLKPLSDKIKEEIEKAKKVVIVEQNATGQLGRLIREKTGLKIEDRILKYDSRPFKSDELRKELMELK